MRPVQVLQFVNTSARGGVEEHILGLLRLLNRERFALHLVAPPGLMEQLAPDLPSDVAATRLKLTGPRDVAAAMRFARLLNRSRIQIVHAHMFQSSLAATPVAWLSGVPVRIETPHIRESWRRGWVKGSFAVDRAVARLVSRFIAVSAANAEYLVSRKGIPASKVSVIRNGCDLKRFGGSSSPDGRLRQGAGIPLKAVLAVVAARLEPQKGHRVLLEAWASVLRSFPGAHLACLGEGSLRSSLEERTRALGMTHSVHWLGSQPRVEDWLAVADLSILPSHYEGLPLAVIEAMAAGLPVVATAVDGTPEAVAPGKTGLIVPPGDADGLAAAISRLLADPALRAAMGTSGRDRAQALFNEERVARQTEGLYLQALAERALSHHLPWPKRCMGEETGAGETALRRRRAAE